MDTKGSIEWIERSAQAAKADNHAQRVKDAHRWKENYLKGRQNRAAATIDLYRALALILPGVTFANQNLNPAYKDGYVFKLVQYHGPVKVGGKPYAEILIGKPIPFLHKADPQQIPHKIEWAYYPVSSFSQVAGWIKAIEVTVADHQRWVDEMMKQAAEVTPSPAPVDEIAAEPLDALTSDTIAHLKWIVAQLEAGHVSWGSDKLIVALAEYFLHAEREW